MRCRRGYCAPKLWPDSDPCYPESADLTLQRIIEILNRQDLVAAAEHLSKGYGLRVVK